jgi:hypothetical protein
MKSAIERLYFAANWHPDRVVDAAALWSAVRDAAGITPGQTASRVGPDRGCERADAVEAKVKTLEKVLREIMGLLDSGYLVRDISHDHENGWAMKQIAPVMILREAAAALKEKP